MNLGLFFLFIKTNLHHVALIVHVVYLGHDSKQLHVHADDLLLGLETSNELVAPHVHI
jgi:hypothetical protein